jgi:CMP-N-acetylneuraminate monooxygenase
MLKLGRFNIISDLVNTEIDLNLLQIGVNSIKNHFVVLDDNRNIISVVDKTCDHAGGRLIHKGNNAVCPMHGWMLDLYTLKYQDSHIHKTCVEYSLIEDKLLIPDKESYLKNPFKDYCGDLAINLRYLNHATIAISFSGITLITDPWLFGPAFMTGWWLDQTSTEDSIEILKSADYIFISHNHPDHLHAETLEIVSKDKNIIVGNFSSKSTEKYLKSLGFRNVNPMEFNFIYQIADNFQFSILKSGDFRDDSGLYLNLNGVEILLTVDANILNSLVLPRNIELLLTSFAGGASGFPLCFENYEIDQKLTVLDRNRTAIRASVAGYLKATSPKYYMPYAGMFKEKAGRDSFILDNNLKNSPIDYEQMVSRIGINYVEPLRNVLYVLTRTGLKLKELDVAYLQEDNTTLYIENLKNNFRYDANVIIDYMKGSGYIGKQILYIIPCNDDFSQVLNDIVYCNFDTQIFKIVCERDIILEVPDFRVMKLNVRQEVFAAIILNRLPWEDFSIGFQMRIHRYPNSYESDFWFHFTNVYIDPIHYKFSKNCGTCNLINQNPNLI